MLPTTFMFPLIYRKIRLFFLLFVFIPAQASATLSVVVTIKPLHSLVAAIMDGAGTPSLLIDTTQSPHHINLRPSDYRKISAADIVFWAGPSMETFLPAIIKKYREHTQFISLMQVDGIQLLHDRGKNHHHNTESVDPHFWLSTVNAKQIVQAVTKRLIKKDEKHKTVYIANREKIIEKIDQLHNNLATILKENRKPFITYHDAYQYFEREFHLNRIASVSLNEEAPPGIKHIRYIRHLINKQHIQCIFFDAPVTPPLINTLITDSSIQAIELDATGTRLSAGPELWFTIMMQSGEKITSCLQTGSDILTD